ncbi:HTH domain-containing protein [Streptomyces sp. MNP-20]|uniref:HTH domain-containing protein n=1 Tax=Streptomyces sp. MNP-20 TaxID=2721165 RepID=UPI0015543404|nr:HTH domain-containing protein [Streptomyces sp. MNP-20]
MTQDLPARMLRLLALLQTRRLWSGTELAERLEVTLRTIRRDIDRLRWRLFRVDRLTDPAPTGHRVTPRELPATDAAAYVATRLAAAPARYTFHATAAADADTVRARTWSLPGRVTAVDEHTATLDLAADNPRHIAAQLLDIDLESGQEITGSPELAPYLEQLGRRLLSAARGLTHDGAGDR